MSDERSPTEPYPGPDPGRGGQQPAPADASPGERGRNRHHPKPDEGADESVTVGDAVASFGPVLGPENDAEKDNGSHRHDPS